jgi:hypothetical protein
MVAHPEPKYIPETLDDVGAARLRQKIEAYWAQQGRAVNCWVEKMPARDAVMRVIRSDLGYYLPPLLDEAAA